MANQPRFEVFPEKRLAGAMNEAGEVVDVLTGQFCWHFKDANGHITFTGGESFTRREDAHRSIRGVVNDVLGVWGITNVHPDSLIPSRLSIVDLDENGKPTLRDNPHLDPEYAKKLKAQLPDDTKRELLEGEWD